MGYDEAWEGLGVELGTMKGVGLLELGLISPGVRAGSYGV